MRTISDPAQAVVARLIATATAALKADRPADAIGPLAQALRLQPRNADFAHDLGLACLECGRLGEAIDALRCAIAARPGYADAYLRLGIAFEKSGALAEALAAYRQACKIQPLLADAHYREGELLDSLGDEPGAQSAYRRAVDAAPKTTLGRIADAKALLIQRRDDEAEKRLREALVTDEDNPIALELLGNILADTGRFAEARQTMLRAIDRSPLRAGSLYDVARCQRLTEADGALIERMTMALTTPGLDVTQRSRIYLALGKAADDFGDYAMAMQRFDAAEALRNDAVRFDLAAFETRVDRVIDVFSVDVLSAARVPASSGLSPILIVGLPRSGTTLMEQLLSAHGSVAAGGELPFWGARGLAWERAGAQSGAPLTAYAAAMGEAYQTYIRALAPAAKSVTDKMPLNFQWLGLIALGLPQARIVHCRRSPIATALSIHQTHFNPRMQFPTGGAALVGYIKAYQKLSAHWRVALPPGMLLEIDYEGLIAEPELIIRRVLDHCGLEWDEGCLHPEKNARPVSTPSKWQARQPIYRSAVDRWRAYEPYLGPLRALLEFDERTSSQSDKNLTKRTCG